MVNVLDFLRERLNSGLMEELVGLLDGPRARDAMVLKSLLDPPWSLRIQDEAPLSVVAMIRGGAWVVPEGKEPFFLRPGEVGLFRGPDPYTVSDDLTTPVQVVINPGQVCTTADGEDLVERFGRGSGTWGNSHDGSTVVICGTYQRSYEINQRFLEALPKYLIVSEDEMSSPLVQLLHGEVSKDEPGQEVVLDRLLDLLIVSVLRAWFSRPGVEVPGWYQAKGDPVVGPALQLLQSHPERPWKLSDLASEVGVSRATLSRRFTDIVGEPPMAFLTHWRMALAADLLRQPDATVTSVAHQVGYGSPYALSAAFKRIRGTSPREHKLSTMTNVENRA